jgi:hypothetical protein
MRTHTVSTASCRVQPARSGAFRVSASTSHSAVPARWPVIRAARAASSASPAIATSIAALSTRALVPNSDSTVG